MKVVSIADVLSGKVPVGEEVEVRGWVRTRRDSKAGLSFIHLSDGSGFAPLQLVANGELTNYESEVKRLTTGCALTARGTLVASQGKGQTVELVPREITVVGWVDDPETYPMQAKQHSMEYLREVGHLRPRTHLTGRHHPRAQHPRLRRAPLLSARGLLLGAHPDHHGE
jgi:asparaginyl-tRNA synthetase